MKDILDPKSRSGVAALVISAPATPFLGLLRRNCNHMFETKPPGSKRVLARRERRHRCRNAQKATSGRNDLVLPPCVIAGNDSNARGIMQST